MRWAARADKNQSELILDLRKCGFAVLSLHRLGQGVPDLLVSNNTDMWLVEVKGPKGKPNALQQAWYKKWAGKPPLVVTTLEEFLQLIRRE